jgi:hypothetical protein
MGVGGFMVDSDPLGGRGGGRLGLDEVPHVSDNARGQPFRRVNVPADQEFDSLNPSDL